MKRETQSPTAFPFVPLYLVFFLRLAKEGGVNTGQLGENTNERKWPFPLVFLFPPFLPFSAPSPPPNKKIQDLYHYN